MVLEQAALLPAVASEPSCCLLVSLSQYSARKELGFESAVVVINGWRNKLGARKEVNRFLCRVLLENFG